MKAYVSIDYEGLPGIASVSMLSPRSSQYGRSIKIVTKIAKIVAEELLKNGFDRVVIADSHGSMTNIDYTELPRNTTLIQGFPRPYSMVSELDGSFKAVLFIGYHASAGTQYAILDHTYSGRTFYRIWINGMRVSEYLLNSLVAGEYGVPSILLAGDSHLEEDVKRYTPWTVFVPLKKGISRYAASYDSFDEVIEELRRGVFTAIQRLKRGEVRPFIVNKPVVLKIEFRDSIFADAAEVLPGVIREDAYTIKYKANNAKEILGIIETLALVAAGIYSLRQYL